MQGLKMPAGTQTTEGSEPRAGPSFWVGSESPFKGLREAFDFSALRELRKARDGLRAYAQGLRLLSPECAEAIRPSKFCVTGIRAELPKFDSPEGERRASGPAADRSGSPAFGEPEIIILVIMRCRGCDTEETGTPAETRRSEQ